MAGYWMALNNVAAHDKIFYTTGRGRATSEMVIKTVKMSIPTHASRFGFTGWSIELGRRSGFGWIGRVRGRRVSALSGEQRILYEHGIDGEGVRDEGS